MQLGEVWGIYNMASLYLQWLDPTYVVVPQNNQTDAIENQSDISLLKGFVFSGVFALCLELINYFGWNWFPRPAGFQLSGECEMGAAHQNCSKFDIITVSFFYVILLVMLVAGYLQFSSLKQLGQAAANVPGDDVHMQALHQQCQKLRFYGYLMWFYFPQILAQFGELLFVLTMSHQDCLNEEYQTVFWQWLDFLGNCTFRGIGILNFVLFCYLEQGQVMQVINPAVFHIRRILHIHQYVPIVDNNNNNEA